MASANQNFGTGIADGMRLGFGLIDRIDGRRRQKRQDERDELRYQQEGEDRTRRIGREDVVWGRQDRNDAQSQESYLHELGRRPEKERRLEEAYKQGQNDYLHKVKRRGVIESRLDRNDAQSQESYLHELGRRPEKEKLQKQIADLKLEDARFGLKTIKSKARRQEAVDIRTKQANVRADIQRITAQAEVLALGGDEEGAFRLYKKANDLSGGEIANQAGDDYERFSQVLEAVSTGKMDIDDPKVVEASRDYARPMMKQTGRYNKYSFNGFEPLPDGRIATTMRNRKTGKIAPATMAQTSHKDDPVVATEIGHLITDVQTREAQAKEFKSKIPDNLLTRIRALRVGAGGKLAKPKTDKRYMKVDGGVFDTTNERVIKTGSKKSKEPNYYEKTLFNELKMRRPQVVEELNKTAEYKDKWKLPGTTNQDVLDKHERLKDELGAIDSKLNELTGGLSESTMPKRVAEPLKAGVVSGGYRFKGGDPKDKNNWVPDKASVKKKPVVKGKGEKRIISYPDGLTKKGGSRSWRNNNPGNLEYGSFAKKNGAIGTDGRFAIFPDKKTGDSAKMALLKTKNYINKSIKHAILRYAPQFENNSSWYANTIAKAAGVSPSQKLSSLTDSQFKKMVNKMTEVEGWKEGSTG